MADIVIVSNLHSQAAVVVRLVLRSISPGGVPQKGVSKEYKDLFPIVSLKCRVLKLKFLAFPRFLEGLGSSGGLVGTISTYPGR